MDGKIATGLGVAAALAAGPVLATPINESPAVQPAASYADLLQPIPNAVERLAQANAEAAARSPMLIEAQYQDQYQGQNAHHHHHHSSDWYRHNGYTWYNGAWVLRPAHHHHHSSSWYKHNGYYWHDGAWVLRPQHNHHHNNY